MSAQPAASSRSTKIPLPTFDGTPSTWKTWKSKFRAYLYLEVGEAVEEALFSDITSADADTHGGQELKQQLDTSLNKKLYSFLVSALNDDAKRHVETVEFGQGLHAWQLLVQAYEEMTIAQVRRAIGAYFTLKMAANTEGITAFIHRANTLRDALKPQKLAPNIPEELHIIVILNGCPESWQQHMGYLYKDTQLTLTTLATELRHMEQLQNTERAEDSDTSGQHAFNIRDHPPASANPNTGSASRGRPCWRCDDKCGRKNGKCTFVCPKCREVGHGPKKCHKYSSRNKERAHEAQDAKQQQPPHPLEWAFMADNDLDTAASASTSPLSPHHWIIDSGATSHFCRDRDQFDNIIPASASVTLANAQCIPTHGTGTIGQLQEVKFAPGMANNLLSVAKLTKAGAAVIFTANDVYLVSPAQTRDIPIAKLQHLGQRNGDLYVHAHQRQSQSQHNTTDSDSAYLWHCRLGHAPYPLIAHAIKHRLIAGVPSHMSFTKPTAYFCQPCALAKSTRKPHAHATIDPATRPLQRVFGDLAGPFRPSRLGKRFMLILVDEYTNMVKGIPLTKKSNALAAFQHFRETAESELAIHLQDCRLEVIRTRGFRSDNGGEFTSRTFEDYCRAQRIHHEHTVPHAHQQNGHAEVFVRIASNMARALVATAPDLQNMWDFAFEAATYTLNRLPSSANPDNKTPIELWTGRPANVAHLRVFGSPC
jgi:Pol polyprotein, beta-barrel domain/Integrase core domain/GAG-pre-integrase domain/gag-polypeptide of LTR copia-type